MPSHFVERHGLVVIVALGESIVVIGTGAAALAIDTGLVLVALLGYWLYGLLLGIVGALAAIVSAALVLEAAESPPTERLEQEAVQ